MTATIPPNWEPQPLSQMRQASFLVHGDNGAVADISFVTLGPAAGNILDNVNRWLGQLAQPPITEEKLKSLIQPLPTARGEVAVVDLSGQPENGDPAKDGRIIGAIAADGTGTAFYKMRGNATLVGTEKAKFSKMGEFVSLCGCDFFVDQRDYSAGEFRQAANQMGGPARVVAGSGVGHALCEFCRRSKR